MKRGLPALALAVAALGLLAAALYYGDRAAPGRTVERPAPHFSLPTLARPEVRFSPEDLRGQVWVLNVWASWCAPCRDELPLLRELARTRLAPLYGLNYMDRRDDATSWLRQLGDPYTVLAPNYGSPFVRDLDNGRRYGTIEDFRNFVKLAYASPYLHHSGGTVCEPVDLPVNKP